MFLMLILAQTTQSSLLLQEEAESLMISQISNRYFPQQVAPPKQIESKLSDERMNLTSYESEIIQEMDKDFIASLHDVLQSQLNDTVSLEDMRYNIRQHLEICYTKPNHPFYQSVSAFVRNYSILDLPLAGDGEKFKHLILVIRSFKRMHLNFVTKKAYKGIQKVAGSRGIILAIVEKHIVAPFYDKMFNYCVPVHHIDNTELCKHLRSLLTCSLIDFGIREEYRNIQHLLPSPTTQPPSTPPTPGGGVSPREYWRRTGSRRRRDGKKSFSTPTEPPSAEEMADDRPGKAFCSTAGEILTRDGKYVVDDEVNELIDFGSIATPLTLHTMFNEDSLEVKVDLETPPITNGERHSPSSGDGDGGINNVGNGNLGVDDQENHSIEDQESQQDRSQEQETQAHVNSPAAIIINPSLSSTPSVELPPLFKSPYHRAVQHIQKLPKQRTPYAKIQCLTRACREICEVIASAFARQRLESVVCDDLIPIFAYCLVQAQIPFLVTEVNFISDLLDESCALGEAGYCFTTLECAIMLVQQISNSIDPQISITDEEEDFRIGNELDRLAEQYKSQVFRHSINEGRPKSHSRHASISSISTFQSNGGNDHHIYNRIAEDAVRKLLNAVDPDSLDGWTFHHTKNDVRVYLKDYAGTGITCIKGIGKVQSTPTVLLDILKDSSNRRHYDEMFVGSQLIERINDSTKIIRMCFKAQRWCFTSKRDFCMLIHWRTLHDGTQVLIGRSVAHDRCPVSPNFVRAKALGGGWVIQPDKEDLGSSCVTYIAHVDLMGNVPTYLKNMVNLNQPMLIHHLRSLFR